MRSPISAAAVSLTLVFGSLLASAQTGVELASGQLQIQGSRLTIYSDDAVNDAAQVLNVGEPGRVRTCYGGVAAACGSVDPSDPRVAGLVVRAELSGPELPEPVSCEILPGGAFILPGFQQAGDYLLENIRLEERSTGRVIGAAEPAAAVLNVRQILLTSATVTRLSLEDLRQHGIDLTQENFQAFNFAVGFAFGSGFVYLNLPVLYESNGQVSGLDEPTVLLDGLPPDLVGLVERWQPPTIQPFALEGQGDAWLDAEDPWPEQLHLPLFGVVVLPGTVTFLNQFFDASLIVANGAPADSDVALSGLEAALQLPSGAVVRVHGSDPPVMPGQPVPVLNVDPAADPEILDSGEQAAAIWTIEGLKVGTHVLTMAVEGEIRRPGREPLPVASRCQAAVDVADARFHLTFSHPDVVREGSAYTLYVTVANMSRATQNLISVELDGQHITGAHKEDPDDQFVRTIETLEPGETETLEYRLVADLTGKVVASTFQTSSSDRKSTRLNCSHYS